MSNLIDATTNLLNWCAIGHHPLKFTSIGNSTIKMTKRASFVSDVYYRKNGLAWQTYNSNTSISLSNNDYVEFENRVTVTNTSSVLFSFSMSGKLLASGDIQSLMNYSDTCLPKCYNLMFDGCSSLLSTPQLTAKYLAPYCYSNMFYNCSGLVSVCELPALELAEGCYNGMFERCTSLVKAQSVLPATRLVPKCYYLMYYQCSSLVFIPQIMASTTANYSCWSMFSECTSLVDANFELYATVMSYQCYTGMFVDCINLINGPKIHATQLAKESLGYMFKGCIQLRNIKVSFINWYDSLNSAFDWVLNCTNTSDFTFTCPKELNTNTKNTSHVLSNWTINKI